MTSVSESLSTVDTGDEAAASSDDEKTVIVTPSPKFKYPSVMTKLTIWYAAPKPVKDFRVFFPPSMQKKKKDGSKPDWFEEVLYYLPIDKLPLCLLPIRQKPRGIQPPRLLYGWPFPAYRIIEVGERKDFSFKHLSNLKSLPNEWFIDVIYTERRIQEITLNDLGVPKSSCVPELRLAHFPWSGQFLALTDNYSRDGYTPPPEDLEKIQKFFEFDQPPRWFLDGEGIYYCWGHHPLKRLSRGLD